MRRVGIIGGLGAAAGVRMFDLVVREYQRRGAAHDDEFPEIIVHSLASLGLDEQGIADQAVLRTDLTRSIEMLNTYDVEVIMIACNSAYQDYEHLRSISRAEVLNMIEITAGVATRSATCIGVISSSSTKSHGLYTTALESRGAKVIQTTKSQQQIIDNVIAKVIAGKQAYDEQCALIKLINLMKYQGATEVILGCTELPLAMPAWCSFIDPSIEMVKML